MVLGSGWASAADALGAPTHEFPAWQMDGFHEAGAGGHDGVIRSYDHNGRRFLLLFGRTHLYEGRGVDAVVHGVRTAAMTGCRTIVLTNAVGSLRAEWAPGAVVLISDHINLTAATPLRGVSFLDMSQAYPSRLREVCRRADPSLPEGVYVQSRGPQYETPAEVRMARAIGGDLVGMSTALETIAARGAGLDVLGISLVTNAAAGLAGSHCGTTTSCDRVETLRIASGASSQTCWPSCEATPNARPRSSIAHRRAGATPRGPVDGQSAAAALRSNARALTADQDFARIAEVMPLRLGTRTRSDILGESIDQSGAVPVEDLVDRDRCPAKRRSARATALRLARTAPRREQTRMLPHLTGTRARETPVPYQAKAKGDFQCQRPSTSTRMGTPTA